MSTRLYYHDSYARSFESSVVDRSADGLRVVLDGTLFYPTSGGQPHDLGVLENIPVVGVVADEADRVAHLLAAPLDPDCRQVHGEIDWARRFDNMQQHSGQHLLSAVFAAELGVETVSVHMGTETSTVELETADLSDAQLERVETRAAELVRSALPVEVSFEDAALAQGLRKPTGRSGEIRIITIAGVDRSACGGTHVHSTAEIGLIQIRSREKLRGNLRLEFVCGERARRRANADYRLLIDSTRILSTTISALPDQLRQLQSRIAESDKIRKRLEAELATHRASALLHGVAPGSDGLQKRTLRSDGNELDRLTAQTVAATAGAAVLLLMETPPSVALACSAQAGHAGQLLGPVLKAVGGKGGGSSAWAQGSVPDSSLLNAVAERLGFPPA